MASVSKETLPGGRVSWSLHWRDADGRQRQKRYDTKREADAARVRIEGELAAGIHRPGRNLTVYMAGKAWITSCEAGDEPLERSTTRQYTQHLELHIAPTPATQRERGEDPATSISLRDDKLSTLTAPRIAAFRDHLIKTRSRRMAAKVMTSLRMLLAAAQERGEITSNPAAAVRVKQQSRHTEPVVIPTKPELRAMVKRLAAAEPVGYAEALIATALFSGLRASELRGLTRARVKLAGEATITVAQRADRWNKIGPVKTKSGRRTVPIGPLLAGILRRWFVARPAGQLGLAFGNGVGNIESLANIFHRVWKPFCAELGLVDGEGKPLYNFHALRHACASIWIEQGIAANRIQAWMGHSSIKVTQDLYGHLFDTGADDAAIVARVERDLLS